MTAPTRKAAFRARENYDVAIRRIQEDYELEMYRAIADGIDWYYNRFPWKYEPFMELRDAILNDARLLIAGNKTNPVLEAIHDNDFDLIAKPHIRGVSSLSALLEEYKSYRGGPTSRGLQYYLYINPPQTQFHKLNQPRDSSPGQQCGSEKRKNEGEEDSTDNKLLKKDDDDDTSNSQQPSPWS